MSELKIEPPEMWADIPGFAGIYQISNHGRVKALSRITFRKLVGNCTLKEKILSAGIVSGYMKICLHFGAKPKRGKNFLIHRLVAASFVKNPDGLPHVNHKDSRKLNNHFSNLEWCTPKGNAEHAVKNARYRSGPNHPMAKLSISDISEIQATKTARNCNEKLASKFNVSKDTIKRWRRQATTN